MAIEGYLAEVIGDRVGGGDDDDAGQPGLDAAVAAGSTDELPDRPAGACLDPAGDCQGAAKTIVRWSSIDSRLWW